MLNCSVEPERGPAAKAQAAACGTPCGMPCGMPVWTPQPRVGLGKASCFLPFPIPFPLPRPPFPSPFFFHFCYVLHSNLISVLFPRFLVFFISICLINILHPCSSLTLRCFSDTVRTACPQSSCRGFPGSLFTHCCHPRTAREC